MIGTSISYECNPENVERALDIVDMRDSGMTFAEIAKRFGISRSRVSQIYERYRIKTTYKYSLNYPNEMDNYICCRDVLKDLGFDSIKSLRDHLDNNGYVDVYYPKNQEMNKKNILIRKGIQEYLIRNGIHEEPRKSKIYYGDFIA